VWGQGAKPLPPEAKRVQGISLVVDPSGVEKWGGIKTRI
jgi:hypothetical protein